MKLVTIPYSRLDPGNAVARAYCVDPDAALQRFSWDYRDPRALRPLADLQAQRARPALGPVLAEYNRAVGGDAERAARIDDGFCVVSGQQVGLLLGPAYTTYKLFTVVNAARELEKELGAPVTPVFWVESEDHDWDEVNRFFWKGRRYRLEQEVPAGAPVADLEVDPSEFLQQMRDALGEGEAWDLVAPDGDVEDWGVADWGVADWGVARWHVRNLARLVEGVVFLEPRLLREPMRAFAEQVARRSDEIDNALAPGPIVAPDGAYLFDATGARRRLPRGAALPEAWSTDVVSRVLVQNAALPVLMAVCGPSEIEYWSQLKQVHELFGVPMPAVLPRDAATIIEQGTARDAAKLGLDLEEIVRGVARPPQAGASGPVADRLRALADEASQLYSAVEDGSLDLPPNADKPFRRTVGRLEEDLTKLAGRLDDARAEAAGAGRRKYEKVLGELRPRDGLQERSHSLFPYLLRHGPELAESLRNSFDPFEIGHYLVRL
ncbi:MAG: bacillithiol biosynthesis protein BshC [Planctomycetota bacterium]